MLLADDIVRAKEQGKIGVIYGTEEARILAGKLDSLQALYKRGLREMQLFWAVPSPLGELRRQPERLRSRRDQGSQPARNRARSVAHEQCGVPTGNGATDQPVVVSHCAVAGISGAKPGGTDQLNDDAIRRIASAGGVICLHFYEGYIRPHHGEHATVVDLVDPWITFAS